MTESGPNPQKKKELEEALKALNVTAKDLQEEFISGSGKGGQKVNKSRNAVRLTHLPTGIQVKVHESRSLELNRFLAKRHLLKKLSQLNPENTNITSVQNTKNHNWFPGHMAKALNELKNQLPQIDTVIEVRDARAPHSSANPILPSLLTGKNHIVLLNKVDLSDKIITNKWLRAIDEENKIITLEFNAKEGLQRNLIVTLEGLEKNKEKKLQSVMVIGLPNCGKSSLINRLSGKKSTKTENKPAVTQKQQWVPISTSLMLLDTPGILWPKIESDEIAYKLLLIKAIKPERVKNEDVVEWFLPFLQTYYLHLVKEKYGDEIEKETDYVTVLEIIGKKRGCILKGNRINYDKTYETIINDFQSGRLGKISLDLL